MRVWKKALHCISLASWCWGYAILELECETLLTFDDSNKCRTDKAVVIAATFINDVWNTNDWLYANIDAGRAPADKARSSYGLTCSEAMMEDDRNTCAWYARHNFTNVKDGDIVSWFDHTKWVVGETVVADSFEVSRLQCSNGIHVFKTREEAEAFYF